MGWIGKEFKRMDAVSLLNYLEDLVDILEYETLLARLFNSRLIWVMMSSVHSTTTRQVCPFPQ